jgi:hypothetical protein
MPLIDVRPITSLHESFTGQSHWLELLAERKRRRITQSRMRPNLAMQRTRKSAFVPLYDHLPSTFGCEVRFTAVAVSDLVSS